MTTASVLPARNGLAPGGLTGTGKLLVFMLRRDRVRFFGWTLGLALLMTYFSSAMGALAETEEDLESFAGFARTPAGAMFGGPGFGFDALTVERFLVGEYGLYLLTGAGLMGLLTVVRHTRAEERAGRTELIRANVVGRHAQLTAALLLATLMATVTALLIAAVMIGGGYDTTGSLVFGAGAGACALAFAGTAAATVQMSAQPRAAAGTAGAVLGAAFALRALGDMAHVQQSGPSWLSWLSPIGWSQQTAPYTLDRWWPLLLSLAFAAATAALGYATSMRRDLGAGLFPPRHGAPRAAPWLNSPLALAFRLHGPGLVGWSAAVLLGSGAYGSFTQPLLDGLEDAPGEVVTLLGGADNLLDGYLGTMGLMWAFVAGTHAVLAVQSLRNEETEGRTEPVLATAVGRRALLGGHLTVVGLSTLWLLLLAGLGDGIGAAASTGDAGLLGETVLGHVAHAPAVWLVLALAALLYGAAPGAVPLVWAVLAYGLFAGFFGPLLELPEVAQSVSPFAHIGEYPAETLSVASLAVLTALAALCTAAALAAFRRRDVVTQA
ncbi:ABC transporter permease [Streptomyces sulphureus]|uniref:ABC transporter permease n=1 Tax=Streptomyces sulphureus TaxID=47758 RepID=UPI00036437D6|nr:hypothetical protein [Streptomyces sulphureus]